MSERDKRAEVNNLKASNAKRETALLKDHGVALGNDAVTILTMRALKDLVIGDDPDRQLDYDLAYQRHAAAAFDDIERDVEAKAQASKLTLPSKNGKVLHLPK